MRVSWSAMALLLASALPVGAEVTVRAAAGRVDITANAAPLADVLDRLARQTGMKVVYEGPAPRQLVSVSLLGRSPAEAVHDLLEGQGLNYALLGDSAGTGVQTLLMTGSQAPVVASSSPSAPASPGGRPRSGPPPMSSPDGMDEAEEEPDDEPPPEVTPVLPGASPNHATEGTSAGANPLAVPGGIPPGLGDAPGPPNPFVRGNPTGPGPTPPPVQNTPPLTYTPPTVPGGFVPVNPLSPLGPFAPLIPAGPGSQAGTPGSATEPPEPKEPPD